MADWHNMLMHTAASKDQPKRIVEFVAEPSNFMFPALTPLKREGLELECVQELVRGNTAPLLKAILEEKLDVELQDDNGYTCMHVAVWRNERATVLTLLDQCSASINIRSGVQQTPLAMAAMRGNLEMIKLFLDRGADIEATDHLEMTPLMLAVQHAQYEAFLVLVYRGANVNTKDQKGQSIAHIAAQQNDVQFLRLLKEMRINLEIVDPEGRTPLHVAAKANALSSIVFLLKNGVDMGKKDTDNLRAIDTAFTFNCDAAVELLTTFQKQDKGFYGGMAFWYLFLILLIYVSYLNYVLPYTANHLIASIIFNISIIFLPVFFMQVISSITKKSKFLYMLKQGEGMDSEVIQSVGKLFEQEKFKEIPKIRYACLTCWAIRPIRSKHCRYCNVCVKDYDHHNKFIGICIAKENRKYYFTWILLQFLTSASYFYLQWRYNDGMIETDSWITYSGTFVRVLFEDSPVNIVIFIATIPVLVYSWWYFFIQVYSISLGLNVNEVLNRHRYKYLYQVFKSSNGSSCKYKFFNKFDEGLVQNWMKFLTG